MNLGEYCSAHYSHGGWGTWCQEHDQVLVTGAQQRGPFEGVFPRAAQERVRC